MRIFKNRGDIYFSKTNKEKSIEQRILIYGLVITVVFTVVFLSAMGIKYHFSAREFFAPEGYNNKEETTIAEEVLPEVSGKTNFLLTINEDEKLVFLTVFQVDLDNISYKATVIKPETVFDSVSFEKTYESAGIENVKQQVQEMLSTKIDYYVDMKKSDFVKFFDEMKPVNYPVLTDIKYRDNNSAVPFSIKIKAGEQKIKGSDFVALERYYCSQGNMSSAGELILASLTQHITAETIKDSDDLFTMLVTNSETNITVRDYSMADSAFTVLSNERVGVGVYNAVLDYNENEVTKKSLHDVKAYFTK